MDDELKSWTDQELRIWLVTNPAAKMFHHQMDDMKYVSMTNLFMKATSANGNGIKWNEEQLLRILVTMKGIAKASDHVFF